MAARKKFSDKRAAEALVEQGGIVSAAAKMLGVHRNTLLNRIRGNEKLKAIVEDSREETIDIAEKQLLQLILEGNLGAVIFLLKTLGKKRGYVERSEHFVSGPDGEAIPHEIRQAAIHNTASLTLLAESLEKSLEEQEASSGGTQ